MTIFAVNLKLLVLYFRREVILDVQNHDFGPYYLHQVALLFPSPSKRPVNSLHFPLHQPHHSENALGRLSCNYFAANSYSSSSFSSDINSQHAPHFATVCCYSHFQCFDIYFSISSSSSVSESPVPCSTPSCLPSSTTSSLQLHSHRVLPSTTHRTTSSEAPFFHHRTAPTNDCSYFDLASSLLDYYWTFATSSFLYSLNFLVL